MKKLDKNSIYKNRALIFVVLLCVFSVLMVVFMGFEVSSFKKTRGEIESVKIQLDKNIAYSNVLKEIRDNSDLVDEEIDACNRILPDEMTQKQIIKNLSDVLKRNNVDLRTVKFNEIVEGDSYKAYPFYIEVDGNFGKVISFLDSLESQEQLTILKTIEFSRSGGKDNIIAKADLINCFK